MHVFIIPAGSSEELRPDIKGHYHICHLEIELAPDMLNILKMSEGDVFRNFNFAREVSLKRSKKIAATCYPIPQPVKQTRNLINKPGTCYPNIIHRKVVKKAMAAI